MDPILGPIWVLFWTPFGITQNHPPFGSHLGPILGPFLGPFLGGIWVPLRGCIRVVAHLGPSWTGVRPTYLPIVGWWSALSG